VTAAAGPLAALSPDELLARVNALPRGLAGTLGIRFTRLAPDRVEAEMPVTPAVHQPFGLLHGGASVALAETIASVGGWLTVDPATHAVVGLEINANHLRSLREGTVTGVGTPLHVGRSTQVWEIRIADEQGRLVCVSRCTLAVVPSAHGGGRAPTAPASPP
jgi:uncharacterized protein (TIGR00369 family)